MMRQDHKNVSMRVLYVVVCGSVATEHHRALGSNQSVYVRLSILGLECQRGSLTKEGRESYC